MLLYTILFYYYYHIYLILTLHIIKNSLITFYKISIIYFIPKYLTKSSAHNYPFIIIIILLYTLYHLYYNYYYYWHIHIHIWAFKKYLKLLEIVKDLLKNLIKKNFSNSMDFINKEQSEISIYHPQKELLSSQKNSNGMHGIHKKENQKN